MSTRASPALASWWNDRSDGIPLPNRRTRSNRYGLASSIEVFTSTAVSESVRYLPGEVVRPPGGEVEHAGRRRRGVNVAVDGLHAQDVDARVRRARAQPGGRRGQRNGDNGGMPDTHESAPRKASDVRSV